MELTKRLKWIADAVKPGSVVADVGTDHGYIPVYLAREGVVTKAYAMDVNKGPLEKAKKNIEENGVMDRVFPLLSDGLIQLKDKSVDTVIIAGMGGMLIKRILEEGSAVLKGVKYLLLSPHHDLEAVRRTLGPLGFGITYEDMLCEGGKTYTLIVCQRGQVSGYTPLEYRWGRELIGRKHPLLKNALQQQLQSNRVVIDHLLNQATPASRERLNALVAENEELEEVISWL